MSRMEMPPRRRTSNSPAPPEFATRARSSSNTSRRAASPAPSAPDTPQSLALPMNPPASTSRSRRSSIGNGSPSVRRSASPAPNNMPLPAVMPATSPNPYVNIGTRSTNIYANDALTSFFRRLTFAPDGSLLFTPAGQYKEARPTRADAKGAEEVTNTVFIYSRAGLNKPPIAHLPGHKKPSIAVKCSPIIYNMRLPTETKQITIDTSANEGDIPLLPEPAHPSTSAPAIPPKDTNGVKSPSRDTPKLVDSATSPDASFPGPKPVFFLPYRIVYAVATQDTVYLYDTQQQSPICVVSNLHYATFTDLTWSGDGNTLVISSSDGFASTLSFEPGELGTRYHGSLQARVNQPTTLNTNTSTSLQPSPIPTPTSTARSPGLVPPPPTIPKQHSIAVAFAQSSSPATGGRPASPTRSESASSIATQSSFPQTPASLSNNPIPTYTKLPSVAIAQPSPIPPLASPTPPMTPGPGGDSQISGSGGFAVPAAKVSETASETGSVLGKRGSISSAEGGNKETLPEDGNGGKKRRIAPTLVSSGSNGEGRR